MRNRLANFYSRGRWYWPSASYQSYPV